MEYVILVSNLVVAFFLLNSMYNCRLKFGGRIWNIDVPLSPKQKTFMRRNQLVRILCIVAFLILIIPVFKSLLTLVFDGFFGGFLLYIGLFVGLSIAGGAIAYYKAMKSPLLTEESNAAILGNLPFVQHVEAQLDQAQSFAVGFDGIALYNNMDYCYDVVHYEDFQMGPLNEDSEVALMGLYFVQKHHNRFSFVIDAVYIPGEPGQRVTVVGSSGYKVAYTEGTPGQSVFKGYIFTRIQGK